MKRVEILVVLLLCCIQLPAQLMVYERDKFNPELKKQLDEVAKRNMQYRKYFIGTSVKTRDSLAKTFHISSDKLQSYLEKLQAPIDSENMEIVTTIIRHYDYPGKTLVGEPTNLVAVFVIMHSNKGKKYYPRVNQAHTKGELPEFAVATLEDYNFVHDGLLQNYGTHAIAVPFLDTNSSKVVTRYYISPVKKSAYINSMRKSRGFTTNIEEYAREIHALYNPKLTWEMVEQMRADAAGK